MGAKMAELENAMKLLNLRPDLADRVRKAVKDGISPATIQEFYETGVPRDVLDRALNASEEYHQEQLAPAPSASPATPTTAPPSVDPTPPATAPPSVDPTPPATAPLDPTVPTTPTTPADPGAAPPVDPDDPDDPDDPATDDPGEDTDGDTDDDGWEPIAT